ncbi:MAG TPA: signal peptidase II [Bacteroidota bacterium]|nr:signal peptidase II [Bacteroidota bacterium]
MKATQKLVVIAVLLVSCIGCDQTTKQIARSSLHMSPPRSFFNDLVRLQYAENPGGMMSFGAELPEETRFWFLTVFVGLLLSGILLFTLFARKLTILQTVALTLVVGGGFSNLLDRLHNDGYVIDFLNVGIGSLRTAIFNVADVLILMGTVLLVFSSPLTGNHTKAAGTTQRTEDEHSPGASS